MKRAAPALLLATLVLVGRGDVHAEDPVLHEFLPEVNDVDVGALLVRNADGEPTAIVHQGEVLPAPEGGERRSSERSMSARPGNGEGPENPGQRSPTFRPDRVTALEGTLGYFTVFNPTIAPFKRVSAMDTVALAGGVPVLGVGQPRATSVAVDPDPIDDVPRDRFWGSVVLDFDSAPSGSPRVPLPSVSPESRILSARTEPPMDLRFERDGVDAFFAVAPPGTRGEVRLVFLTDAPRDYFNRASIPDVPADVFATENYPLEAVTRADGLRFAAELGLRPGVSMRRALEVLSDHFRSFVESQEPPASSGNIYLDLSRGRKGVCRHRAYGFVITAQALGIRARFVQNEAHAWVEVKLPRTEGPDGWMRIDLGGAAGALEAHGAEDRPVHRPSQPDPLPQPGAYRQSYSQLAGDVRGLRSGEGDRFSSTRTTADGEPAPVSDDPGGEPTNAEAPAEGPEVADAPEPDRPAPNFTPVSRARPVRLALDQRAFEVFRGRTLTVTGVATDPDGGGAGRLRVEVLLRGREERLLGVTASRADGRFRASVGVPANLPVGDYRLVVRTPGDERFFPAQAR